MACFIYILKLCNFFVLSKTDCILLLCGWHVISYIYVFKVKRFLCYEKQTLFNYNVDGIACFIYIFKRFFVFSKKTLFNYDVDGSRTKGRITKGRITKGRMTKGRMTKGRINKR